jgi:hypothetical protein
MLNIYKKINNELNKAKKEASLMGYTTCDNIITLSCALEMTKNLKGSFVECGVFEGNTLITSAIFMKNQKINKNIFGADTFNGFDPSQTSHQYDLPEIFEKLYSDGKITKDHLEKSKNRIKKNKLKNHHLDTSYFSNINKKVFSDANYLNINLLKGKFSKTLPSFNEPISVLHIDCDLYEPYLECLNFLYDKVVPGGIIIFDEYYSLKYPGARIAVDEFLFNRNDYKLKMFKTEDFERWYLVKN